MMNADTIAKYEAKGFNRWQKGSFDRLYIDATSVGLDVSYYKTGNVSRATWQGERISNADARRLLSSKAYVDVKTGELHVRSDFEVYDMPTLEEKVREVMESIESEGE